MGKILFVGDVVIRREDSIELADDVKRIFSEHEYKCCNLEGPICTSEKPINKIGPSIKQHIASANVLREMGFNVYCLANNHIADYGISGLEQTKEVLKNEYVLGAGKTEVSVYKPIILNIDGVSVGILNAAESGFGCAETFQYGYAWINSPIFTNSIKKLKESCTYVICVVHAGLEEFEYPLPEWKDKYRELIDQGADMIIGHHPHVLQGYEEYHGKMIFYSLGNFIWQKRDTYQTETAMLSVEVTPDGMKYQIYGVDTGNNKIKMLDSNEIVNQLKNYNKVFEDREQYMKQVNEKCMALFDGFYLPMYYQSLGICARTPRMAKLKIAVKLLINRMRPRYDVFFHNIEIETHYFASRHAARFKYQTYFLQNENP